jgi:HPt (histidine-containing phosphotransfer) domain-containing protein
LAAIAAISIEGRTVNHTELKRTIAKLRAAYADQLPGTVAQMEELWRRLVAAEIPPLRVAELGRMAHSISGSGTTFGVPSATRAARDLELFLDQFAQSGRLPGPAEQETVAALLAALRQAAVQR